MNELDVVGVRVQIPDSQSIVLLREVGGDRYLPIWVGATEATAIAHAQLGMVHPRPWTHELIQELLKTFERALRQVRITEVRDGVFYSELVFDNDVQISSRPSDAIALALRVGASIYATDVVLDEGGIVVTDERDDEVEKFREFLDTVSPDDFGHS